MTVSSAEVCQPVILGFDPGLRKCGLAVMGLDRRLHYQQVVATEQVVDQVQALQQQFPVSIMVMGNQTTAKLWRDTLNQLADAPRIVLVDERYSTLEARERYWEMYPPQGLVRLLPKGLRNPPRPIDDIVAILLIERYLNQLTS